MSEVVVRMEMPNRCPCVLAVDNIGWFSPCFADHGIPSRTKDFDDCIEKGTRPDWCPIKGVLPEEHGDLIDRDALMIELMDRGIEGVQTDDLAEFQQIVMDAKAVIAAERKDDEQIH